MTHANASAPRMLDRFFVAQIQGAKNSALSSVLMFSGGRDSTAAALRMCETGATPMLVTISSGHLSGIDRVRERVREIECHVPAGTPWLIVRQPTELRTDTSFYEQTCLPCHHAYVVAGAALAAKAQLKTLAFGYVGYQNGWPEQTELATDRLARVLSRYGIELSLPVYDLASRDQVTEELAARGVSTASLEQKCMQQVTNVILDDERLRQQVDLWEHAIDASMSKLSSIDIEIADVVMLGKKQCSPD